MLLTKETIPDTMKNCPTSIFFYLKASTYGINDSNILINCYIGLKIDVIYLCIICTNNKLALFKKSL